MNSINDILFFASSVASGALLGAFFGALGFALLFGFNSLFSIYEYNDIIYVIVG